MSCQSRPKWLKSLFLLPDKGIQISLNKSVCVIIAGGFFRRSNWTAFSLQADALTILERSRQLQTLRLLIEARADKDLRQSYYGRTALIYSASQGQVEVVRFLLECRANLNAADNQMRNTALEHASARGHAEVTRLLLEAGARSRKEFGLACSQGHVEVVEKLLVAGRPVDSDAGLIHAASESRETVARLLLKAGADVDIEDDYCRTALMHAARGGDFAMFSLLLEASADACVIDSGGDTALISASTHGHVEIVRRLLETKADTEALGPCVDSITALMGACENGHLETARLLLEAGADKDKLDRLGGTAITRASERGHVDIVELLQVN